MEELKPVEWLGTSRRDIRAFPNRVKLLFGTELMALQAGYDPADWKPMSVVGPGVREIRVQHESQYRIIYVAKFADAIYVLHAFRKKTQKTSMLDIEIARSRLKMIRNRT